MAGVAGGDGGGNWRGSRACWSVCGLGLEDVIQKISLSQRITYSGRDLELGGDSATGGGNRIWYMAIGNFRFQYVHSALKKMAFLLMLC